MYDLAVVGSGPAGFSVAAHAAGLGLRVVCVAPDPAAPWTHNYGAWLDELQAAGLGRAAGPVWPKVRVHLDEGRVRSFSRAYARIDNQALRAELSHRAGSKLELHPGRVTGVKHDAQHSLLQLEQSEPLPARVVVDAAGVLSGPRAARADEVAAQVAFGRTVTAPGHGFALDEMVLMDFRPAGSGSGPVSFVYAMPLAPDRLFLEETVLVGRPAPSMSTMQALLHERIEGLGLRVEAVHDEERCFIPMGGPLPAGPTRVVPFGAAAAMVHPATGYMLNRALALAPRLAEALVHGLSARPMSPEQAAALGWQVVWPRARRQAWAVYRFGMELLLNLDRVQTADFFAAFFDMPVAGWSPYLSGRATGPEIARAMAAVFARVPTAVRARILKQSLGPSGTRLLFDLTQSP